MFNIPIIINNFNRLSTTRKLVEDLQKLGYNNIHILDNKSTYEPLLEWYKTKPCVVKELHFNLQAHALWDSRYILNFQKEPWIVYTDSDLELNPDTPNDFIQRLSDLAFKHIKDKVGLALEINDLPDTEYANTYKNWESQFWTTSVEPEVYLAAIDTTFAIIRPTLPFTYDALRVAGNFTCKHIPWYTDFKNLTEEEEYYIQTAKEASTYRNYYETQKTK